MIDTCICYARAHPHVKCQDDRGLIKRERRVRSSVHALCSFQAFPTSEAARAFPPSPSWFIFVIVPVRACVPVKARSCKPVLFLRVCVRAPESFCNAAHGGSEGPFLPSWKKFSLIYASQTIRELCLRESAVGLKEVGHIHSRSRSWEQTRRALWKQIHTKQTKGNSLCRLYPLP